MALSNKTEPVHRNRKMGGISGGRFAAEAKRNKPRREAAGGSDLRVWVFGEWQQWYSKCGGGDVARKNALCAGREFCILFPQ